MVHPTTQGPMQNVTSSPPVDTSVSHRSERFRLLPAIGLVAFLYLMYSPAFLTDYLMEDEWGVIGSRGNLRRDAIDGFFTWGRSLFGIYSTLVYRFVGYSPARVQLVRFLNFVGFAGIAIVLYIFLSRRTQRALFSALVVLFLFSQPPFQAAMGFSLQLISNTQPAMWLSLLAFYIYFVWSPRKPFHPLFRAMAVFVLLILAMQSTQTYAFFCMVPLTYLTLCDWKSKRRRILQFVALAVIVFIVSTLMYQAGLYYSHIRGRYGYPLGEEDVTALRQHPMAVFLHALNPVTYWSAFEVWNYPFPLDWTPPIGTLKIALAFCIMIGWVALIVSACITEAQGHTHEQRQDTLLKWLLVLVCLAFGAIFIVADSPLLTAEPRPHMALTFVGVAVVAATYSLLVLAERHQFLRSRMSLALGVFVVTMVAFGAQTGLVRGYVNNRAEQLDFIRAELIATAPSAYHSVIVVLPDENTCVTEPCGRWTGAAVDRQVYKAAGYRYALATLGIAPESKTITFVRQRPDVTANDAVVIDWQRYALAQHRLRAQTRFQTPAQP